MQTDFTEEKRSWIGESCGEKRIENTEAPFYNEKGGIQKKRRGGIRESKEERKDT